MEETAFALRHWQTVSVTKINKWNNNVLFINSLCFLCSWQVVLMPYVMFMRDCKSCVCSWSLSARLIQPTGDCAVRDCHGNRGPVDYRNYHTVANCVNPGCRNAEPHPETQVFLAAVGPEPRSIFQRENSRNNHLKCETLGFLPDGGFCSDLHSTYMVTWLFLTASAVACELQSILSGVMRGSGLGW